MKELLEKLENTVEPAMKIFAYVVFVGSFLFSEFYLFVICKYGFGYYMQFSFNVWLFILGTIFSALLSYLLWAGVMFSINIGFNIKRIRILLEKRQEQNNEEATEDIEE